MNSARSGKRPSPCSRARRRDLAYVRGAYPQTAPREFRGLAHAELVLMQPERFYREAARLLQKGF